MNATIKEAIVKPVRPFKRGNLVRTKKGLGYNDNIVLVLSNENLETRNFLGILLYSSDPNNVFYNKESDSWVKDAYELFEGELILKN